MSRDSKPAADKPADSRPATKTARVVVPGHGFDATVTVPADATEADAAEAAKAAAGVWLLPAAPVVTFGG
jgi:hypothetical protein